MLTGTPVALPEMLARREARAAEQAELLARWHAPLISFCLNIPGPVKTTPALRRLFDDGLAQIHARLARNGYAIRAEQERHAATGDECLLAAAGDAAALKEQMTSIEDAHPLGRLFDIDVIDAASEKLSRPAPRLCLLCGRQAQDCARSRRHSVEELTAHIEMRLRAYEIQKRSAASSD